VREGNKEEGERRGKRKREEKKIIDEDGKIFLYKKVIYLIINK
jgi:hypothetical protein